MAPSDPSLVASTVAASPLQGEYGTAVDRESAYERLNARLVQPGESVPVPAGPEQSPSGVQVPTVPPMTERAPSIIDSALSSPVVKAAAVAAAATIGREIMRGFLRERPQVPATLIRRTVLPPDFSRDILRQRR
jgi:hypothetical protein